uniref:Uncharacterized protein n=1 Tax=Cacopsylla melanoneura TaxID=428564 RepID=A0A8D8UK26_9HEMI
MSFHFRRVSILRMSNFHLGRVLGKRERAFLGPFRNGLRLEKFMTVSKAEIIFLNYIFSWKFPLARFYRFFSIKTPRIWNKLFKMECILFVVFGMEEELFPFPFYLNLEDFVIF